LATNYDAVLCCAAGNACKEQAKYKRREAEAAPRIPSTIGNPWQKRLSGFAAMQNGEKITIPNKRTRVEQGLGALFFPANPC
jgi:hypothetical protein